MAGKTGDEHVVEREVARKAPVLHLTRDAPAAAEFHRADAGRKHLRVDNLAVALLDQLARHAAPAEVEGERKPDRTAADDEHGNIGAARHRGNPKGYSSVSGFPPKSSARSTLISTPKPFLSGSRPFSGSI